MNGYFNYKDELYHYGVLGMRWGVRRYQDYGEGGYNPKTNKLKLKMDAAKRRKYDKRREKALNPKNARELYSNRKYLSDQELKEKSERFFIEKQLKDISEGDVTVGEKVASELMVEAGKTVLKVAAIAGVAYVLSKTDTGKQVIQSAKNVYKVAKKTVDIASSKADVAKDITKTAVKLATNPSEGLKDVRKAAAATSVAKNYVGAVNKAASTVENVRTAAASSGAAKTYVDTVNKVINTAPVEQIRKDIKGARTAVSKSSAARKYVKTVNKFIKR